MVGVDICELCKKEAKQKCGGCLSVFYCTKEHQKLDWKNHKNNCTSFKVVEDDVLGRCLVSTRNIRSGEVILKEKPLLSGPSQVTGPVCLGCHNGLPGPRITCSKCGWPLCSVACEGSPAHLPECQWAISKRKEKVKITNFTVPHPTYACITALRVLHAKLTNPKLWSKISFLESHNSERMKDGKYEQDRFAVAKLLRRFYKLEEEVTEEEILEICGIIQINGHEVPLSEPGYISVYWKCSLLEHDCRPNCSKSFTDTGELLIRAAVDIPAGQHISICYTDPLWGTPSRLHHLTNTKYFSCQCRRCEDPTELGTYFSAISCSNGGCKGKLLPGSFKDPSSEWRCGKCDFGMSPESVSEILSSAAERLSGTNKTIPRSCKEFLDQSSSLTDNHYHRVEVKLALAQLIGQTTGGLASVSDEWLLIKEALSKELLALASILFPAECRIKGILFFELHAALAERARRNAVRGGDTCVPEELIATRKYLENCIAQLKYEPHVLPEGRIAKQAMENLNDLEKLLKSMNVSIIGGL